MDPLVPTIRDLRPYPESAEARALGCHCAVARRGGKPMFARNGAPVFAIHRGCPVHDNSAAKLVIWDGSDSDAGSASPAQRASNESGASLRPDNGRALWGLPGDTSVSGKTLIDFVFDGTAIDESLVRKIHEGDFLDNASNIVFVGAPGTGKTHLAHAVAGNAIHRGKRGFVFDAFSLVRRLEHEFDGGAGAFMFDLTSADFLVIDELGYLPIALRGRRLLYSLLARLHERTSVIVTTQVPLAQWSRIFRDAHLTQALIDRFSHHCVVVETGAESWRARKRLAVLSKSHEGPGRTLARIRSVLNKVQRDIPKAPRIKVHR